MITTRLAIICNNNIFLTHELWISLIFFVTPLFFNYELNPQQRKNEENKINSEKKEIGWGNQIRSYILHPYKLIKDLRSNTKIMIAGNIQIDDDLETFNKIADIIDISGGLETSGLKDMSKIDIFLNNLNKIKNET